MGECHDGGAELVVSEDQMGNETAGKFPNSLSLVGCLCVSLVADGGSF